MWHCILTLCCFLDSPPRTVLSNPALEPDEVCSFPGILMITFYSLVSLSRDTALLSPSLQPVYWSQKPSLGGSGAAWMSVDSSLLVIWGLNAHGTSVWVEDVTASIQPILAVWAHYTGGFLLLFRSVAPLPQSLRKSFYGILSLHSLLSLSHLCRKCHFAGVKPIKIAGKLVSKCYILCHPDKITW